MLHSQLNQLELEREFKRLGKGLELSMRSSFKISSYFLRKLIKGILSVSFYLLESPKLMQKVSPQKVKEHPGGHQADEIRPYLHPPNFKF